MIEGAIEFEAGFSSNYAGDNSSELTAATVELVIDSTINESISSHILLLHENDTPLEVDEATIQFAINKGISVTVGQLYLLFGSYETNMISDSLLHEFSESRETAIQIDYQSGAIASSLYIFNGDVLEVGADESIDSLGFNIAYTTGETKLGLGYINNLTDSNLMTDSLISSSTVAGLSVYANTTFDKKSLFFEHTTAQDEFESADLAFAGGNAQPSTTNIEMGYELDDAVVAVAVQTTSEAIGFRST